MRTAQELELLPEERAMQRLGVTFCVLLNCPGDHAAWLIEVVSGNHLGEQLAIEYRRPIPHWPDNCEASNLTHNWTHTPDDGNPPC